MSQSLIQNEIVTHRLLNILLSISVQPDGRRHELGRTETIQDNLNPVFEKKLIVDYFFEERQVLIEWA